jgi:hypothetical protein
MTRLSWLALLRSRGSSLRTTRNFGELVFRSGHAHAGVVLLRLRDESPANRVRVMQAVLDQCQDSLAGRFVTAGESQIRVREVR